MSGCGTCAKVRAHLPAAIRVRLAAAEARMRARKASQKKRSAAVGITYSVRS